MRPSLLSLPDCVPHLNPRVDFISVDKLQRIHSHVSPQIVLWIYLHSYMMVWVTLHWQIQSYWTRQQTVFLPHKFKARPQVATIIKVFKAVAKWFGIDAVFHLKNFLVLLELVGSHADCHKLLTFFQNFLLCLLPLFFDLLLQRYLLYYIHGPIIGCWVLSDSLLVFAEFGV